MELSCSDDGSTVVCLGARVNVFDIRNRIRISSAHPFSHPSQAAFSPDGKLLAVKNTVGGIVVLDPATGNVIYDFKNQKEAEGSEVLFSPDGKKVIDASWQGEIRVRNMFEPTVVSQQSFHGEMISRISHDRARRIWLFEHHPIVRPGENWPSPPYLTLDKWPIGKRKAKVLSLDLDLLASSTLSPDAGRICFVSTRRRVGGWIKIAKASDGEVVATSEEIKIGGTGCELAWSSDGKYVGSVQARRFVFYHSSDLSVIGEVPCTYPSSICFLPGTEDVVLGSWNSSVLAEINDIAAGKVKMK
jgi:WD40 repeat protein